MNEISQFRRNVQEMFARELGIQVFPGLMEGPNQFGEWLGSLYLRQIQEDPQRVAEQQIYLVLRVFAPVDTSAFISATSPYDPQPLEDMASKVLDAISRNQTGLGAWYQRVTAIEIDPETQGIQATLFAYSSNPGVGFTA